MGGKRERESRIGDSCLAFCRCAWSVKQCYTCIMFQTLANVYKSLTFMSVKCVLQECTSFSESFSDLGLCSDWWLAMLSR